MEHCPTVSHSDHVHLYAVVSCGLALWSALQKKKSRSCNRTHLSADKAILVKTLERFRDRQTTNTNTCGWAPYSYTLTFGSSTEILTKRIRIRIQRRRLEKFAAPRPFRVPRPLSCTLRVCTLTAVVYEYTLRLSSRHFFTAVKLIRKVRR